MKGKLNIVDENSWKKNIDTTGIPADVVESLLSTPVMLVPSSMVVCGEPVWCIAGLDDGGMRLSRLPLGSLIVFGVDYRRDDSGTTIYAECSRWNGKADRDDDVFHVPLKENASALLNKVAGAVIAQRSEKGQCPPSVLMTYAVIIEMINAVTTQGQACGIHHIMLHGMSEESMKKALDLAHSTLAGDLEKTAGVDRKREKLSGDTGKTVIH